MFLSFYLFTLHIITLIIGSFNGIVNVSSHFSRTKFYIFAFSLLLHSHTLSIWLEMLEVLKTCADHANEKNWFGSCEEFLLIFLHWLAQ